MMAGLHRKTIFMIDQNEINKLVDQKSIDAWTANFTALTAAKASADSRLDAAQQALKLANRASEDAVKGVGGLSVEDAEDAIILAEKACRIAIKLANHADAQFNHERSRERTVIGLAHKGVYEAGIKASVEACRAGDAANAALKAAQKAYEDARHLMIFAVQHHCSDISHSVDRQTVLKTEAEERHHWTANRIDPDAPSHHWAPE
jgi:hypothetical protein